jgi:hypothetical protein
MIYDGEFKKGMPEGYGRCVWWNGAHYVGYWADGEMHGQGSFTYSDGTLEEGEFLKGVY